MYKLGQYNDLKINRQVDFGVYLIDDAANEILLPARYLPKGAEVGDTVHVFVYTDSEDRVIATTATPKVVVGDIACLDVVDVNRIGAFLDWGLEKDLLLPYKLQTERLNKGDKCTVKVIHDEVSNRIIATTKIYRKFLSEYETLAVGDNVNVQVAAKHELGFAVIVEDCFPGMIYDNEIFEPIAVGERRSAYIKKVRDDGKLDISLKPQGFKAGIDQDKAALLTALEEAEDHFLPFTAKSDADAIKDTFKMSKKAFKKALGGLYKERLIILSDSGMTLNDA